MLIALEAACHTLFRLATGSFIWQVQPAFFHVRSFTEQTGDQRIVTATRSFANGMYAFDENRFRRGDHAYSPDSFNIVFIGDSVPFGWAVSGDQTIQSSLSGLLDGVGIINAALPSYTLHQALARYEMEIHNRFKTGVLIVQVYDPASQFAIWGRQWSPEISWASDNRKFSRRHVQVRNSPLLRYSSLLFLLVPRRDERGRVELALTPDDTVAVSRFRGEVVAALELLHSLANAPLVLLPINLTEHARTTYPTSHLFAVNTFNGILESFDASHNDAYFFDVAAHFSEIGEEGLFSDDCCHLTAEGNRVQAEFLVEEMRRRSLL